MGYPLTVIPFTNSTHRTLQRNFSSVLVSKCDFNRKAKHGIIYNPACLGGAYFGSLFSIQGIGQVMSFLKYSRRYSQAGKTSTNRGSMDSICNGYLGIFPDRHSDSDLAHGGEAGYEKKTYNTSIDHFNSTAFRVCREHMIITSWMQSTNPQETYNSITADFTMARGDQFTNVSFTATCPIQGAGLQLGISSRHIDLTRAAGSMDKGKSII